MKTVVCLGDSITLGRVGENYVKMLKNEFDRSYSFINRGVNGDLSYNILNRLNEIILLNSDFIILLIGTNDVWATQSKTVAEKYMKKKKLTEYPSKESYEGNLRTILLVLQNKTNAKIALSSLPPIDEDEKNILFLRTMEYSKIIKDIAVETGVDYLDLNERQIEYIKAAGSHPKNDMKVSWDFTGKVIFEHLALFRSWDKISENNGFIFTVDKVHQNTRGASVIKDCAAEFLKKYK